MSDSLRDQLLGLGFKPAPKPERPAGNKPGASQGKPQHGKPSHGRQGGAPAGKPQQRPAHKPGAKPQRSREEIDLAKAYALRSQREKDERIAAEAAKQEEARKRREARAKLTDLVKDKALNNADADIARHFPYGGKIKRVYVTAEQLKALNAGELGVLQLDGRYVLVSSELMAQAAEIFPAAIALRVDPDAPAEDDPYADPQFQVPDDLVW
ncbi:uncharacterized protein YaiL (DUF2058 family) [Lysobacter niabensis]|uniref:Uncharacterized protein YaiL (DUF2058 family) n=1 Tax=Agrilutibacter niabensis TaxID=380628 RepID=A0ABU1VMQ2_9GAMM|nr:DUF2058 family protein [Lysobacter niabensis]MDR7098757.1 uncharacterized protein YaiL (DUF2058 family) [Lysobacter niabensis]